MKLFDNAWSGFRCKRADDANNGGVFYAKASAKGVFHHTGDCNRHGACLVHAAKVLIGDFGINAHCAWNCTDYKELALFDILRLQIGE